jgi:uncharacterized membrane protein
MAALRKYLIAGLLVWVPLGVTVFVLKFLVEFMDRTLVLLPLRWRPEALLGFPIPGLGVVLAFLILLFTGMIVANLFGRKLVQLWERFLARIPFVRSIYSSVKQITETIFSSSGRSFRKVVLLQFPREGTWTIAFITSDGVDSVERHTGEPMTNLFVPTAPNPTSGYFLMVPTANLVELEMSIDDALKIIISGGAVIPGRTIKTAD